jgi:hypothetical protein
MARHSLWLAAAQKKKGFTGVAVLMLAPRVGANRAILSIPDRLLLRKPAVRNADELVRGNSVSARLGPPKSPQQTYYACRDKSPAFSSVLTFLGVAAFEVTKSDRTVVARGELVLAGYSVALLARLGTGWPRDGRRPDRCTRRRIAQNLSTRPSIAARNIRPLPAPLAGRAHGNRTSAS